MTGMTASDESMERACFMLEIRPGMEEEYDRRHRAIGQEFEDEMRSNGASNYSLFRRGRTVVGVLDCRPDARTVLGKGRVSPLSVAWADAMTEVIAHEEGGLRVLTEVWHLD